MNLKLADFGLCVDVTLERPVTRCGTLDFMSPELLRCPRPGEDDYNKDRALYNAKVDVWAVGVLAYELLSGLSPFSDPQVEKSVAKIMYAQIKFPTGMSANAINFVLNCLERNVDKRATTFELMGHPWVLSLSRAHSTAGAPNAAARPDFSGAALRPHVTFPGHVAPLGAVHHIAGASSNVSPAISSGTDPMMDSDLLALSPPGSLPSDSLRGSPMVSRSVSPLPMPISTLALAMKGTKAECAFPPIAKSPSAKREAQMSSGFSIKVTAGGDRDSLDESKYALAPRASPSLSGSSGRNERFVALRKFFSGNKTGAAMA